MLLNIFSSSYSSSLFNNEDLLKSISNLEFQINEVSDSISRVEKQILDLEMPIKYLLDKHDLSEKDEEKKKYFLEEKASLREEKASLRRKEESLRESLRRKEESLIEKKSGIL